MKEMGRSIIEAMSGMDRVSVNVKAFETCGAKGKIRVSVVASTGSTKNDILTSINALFNGRLRAVARSFRLVENSSQDRTNVQVMLEGYVVPNVEIVATASDEGKVMKCVASNMFMDAQDCIWSKTGDFLYKKSEVETSEELNKFLTECSSSNIRMRKQDKFESATIAGGDFISYMHAGEMCYGFALASAPGNKLLALAEGEEEPEIIDAFDVQSQVPINDDLVNFPEEDELVETSASAGVDINAVTSYYKRWFVYNKDYANQLISRLKGHAFV